MFASENFPGLPWVPKVRQKDVDMFLDMSRLKFVGYKLQGDRESLAGLPQPIHEGLSTLKRVRKIFNSCKNISIICENEKNCSMFTHPWLKYKFKKKKK